MKKGDHHHYEEEKNVDFFQELEIFNVFTGKLDAKNLQKNKRNNLGDRFINNYKVTSIDADLKEGHHFNINDEFVIVKSGDFYRIKFTNKDTDVIENVLFIYHAGEETMDLSKGDRLLAWRVPLHANELHYIQMNVSEDKKEFVITFYDKAKNHYGDVHGPGGG
jgi:hypothetical protein